MEKVSMISESFIELWGRFINFLPALLSAILIFFVGWLIASIASKVVIKLIRSLRIDQLVEKTKAGDKFKEAGLELSVSKFFGELVKWFLILVFLMAATNVLGLFVVSQFLNDIILYIPNIVVATIILSVAFLLGGLVYSIVRSSTKAAGVMSASLLAVISKWAIIITGLLAALIQLGIAETMLNTIFIGIVASLALAAGLAFGLGGRDEAALILKKIRNEIEEKH